MKKLTIKQTIILFIFKYVIAMALPVSLTASTKWNEIYNNALPIWGDMITYLSVVVPITFTSIIAYIVKAWGGLTWDTDLDTWDAKKELDDFIKGGAKLIWKEKAKLDASLKHYTETHEDLMLGRYINKHYKFLEIVYKKPDFEKYNSLENILVAIKKEAYAK